MTRSEFKKLQAHWYGKLAATGWVDLEKGDKFRSQGWMAGRFQFEYTGAGAVRWNNKEEYYRLCSTFLHENQFASRGERRIWELHTEGVSDQKISDRLCLRKGKLTRWQVWSILNELEQKMLYGRAQAEKLKLELAEHVKRIKAARREVKRMERQAGTMRLKIAKVGW